MAGYQDHCLLRVSRYSCYYLTMPLFVWIFQFLPSSRQSRTKEEAHILHFAWRVGRVISQVFSVGRLLGHYIVSKLMCSCLVLVEIKIGRPCMQPVGELLSLAMTHYLESL